MGCVSQAGDQGANITRNALMAADWPEVVTGVTLNRFCGSGLQAVNFAAMGVMSGQQEVAMGGGVESMSRAPMGSDGAGADGNNELLRDKVFQVPQGISADLIATIEGFSREDVDRFALQSPAACASGARSVLFLQKPRARERPSHGRHRPGQRRASARRDDARRLGAARCGLRKVWRFTRHRRRDLGPRRAPPATPKSKPSTTCTPPAMRAASSMAPRPCSWPPTTT